MRAAGLAFSLVFVSLGSLACARPCLARLGGRENSVESDRAMMHGVRTVTSHALFRIHEIDSTGEKIREYVGNDGNVFAVTWRGIGTPDLSQLFGSYYQEYLDADAATPRPRGRAPKIMRSSNLVIRRFGHMGDVRGKAYIPALMPNGVSLHDIR